MVISFLTLSLVAYSFDKILPVQMKRFAFILAISFITIFLYQATFLINFHAARVVVIIAAVLFAIVSVKLFKMCSIMDFLKGNKVFFISSLTWFLISLKARLHNWDEFSWASFVKHINQYGTYWNSKSAILPQGMRYFPGLSLWESFFESPNNYSEAALYFSLGLIFISGLNIFLSNNVDRFKKVGISIAYILIFCWFSSGVSSIYVDAAMGIILGLMILSIHELNDPKYFWIPVVIAAFLAITKETGFCLSLIAIFNITLKILKNKNYKRNYFVFPLLGLMLIVFNFILWRNYLAQDLAMGSFDFNIVLKQMQVDFHALSNRSSETLNLIFTALFNRPIAYGLLARTSAAPFVAFFGSFIFWTILIVSIFIYLKDLSEYVVTFLVGLSGYLFLLIITFLYFFTEVEGRSLASYERYMGVYFLGFSLLILKLLIDRNLLFKKGVVAAFVVLFILMPPSPRRILPSSILDNSTAKLRNDLEPIKNEILKKTTDTSRVWFIQLGSIGMEAMILRYEVAPRVMNGGLWSVGEKYFEGDVWTENISLKTFSENMNNYDYMAFANVDARFIERYGSLFSTTPKAVHLYKKTIINNQISMIEVP